MKKQSVFFVSIAVFWGLLGAINDPLKSHLDQLYDGISGFGISEQESKLICQQGGAPTYGEITYDSVKELIAKLNLTKEDVFYDLGSGVGKLVVQIFLGSPVKKSVGIELSEERYAKAQKVYATLERTKKIPEGRALQFCHDNILNADIHDATVVFMCSTCFSTELMQKLTEKLSTLKPALRILTLKPLPDNKWFELVKTESFPMTWSSNSPIYFYAFKKQAIA